MVMLKQQLQFKYKEKEEAQKAEAEAKKERILASLPDIIPCQKCGGPNSFDNVVCNYCGCNLHKKPFFIDPADLVEDEQNEESTTKTEQSGDGYTFHRVISFLIPLIGFIVGGIMLANDKEKQRECGKTCIILAVVSMVLGAIFAFLLW